MKTFHQFWWQLAVWRSGNGMVEKLPGWSEADNLSFSARLWSPEKEVVIFRNESCIFAISKNIWLVQRTTHIIVMEPKRWKTAEIKYPLPILFPLLTYNCYWSTIQVLTFNFQAVQGKNWKIPIIIGQGLATSDGNFSLAWLSVETQI